MCGTGGARVGLVQCPSSVGLCYCSPHVVEAITLPRLQLLHPLPERTVDRTADAG